MAAESKPRATSGTSDKAFVDSNVLIYAHDVDAGRKREVAKGLLEARRVVGTYIPWCLAPETGDVNEAFRIEDEAGISFWDALIVASATRSGATRLLSEDLNPEQIISGVTLVNPFDESAPPT